MFQRPATEGSARHGRERSPLYETTTTDKGDTDPAVICELQLPAGRLAVAVPLADVRAMEMVPVN